MLKSTESVVMTHGEHIHTTQRLIITPYIVRTPLSFFKGQLHVRHCVYSRTFYSNWMVEIEVLWFVLLSSGCELWSDFTFWQDPSASVEKRREVVLRCLIEYMGERQEDLISVHHVCIGLKATCLFFCLYVLILWWYGVITFALERYLNSVA